MKLPPGAISFPVPIYGGRVVLCSSRKAWQEVSTLLGEQPEPNMKRWSGLSQHVITKNGRSRYLVGMFDKSSDGTLVHEMAHAAFQILRHADVRISHANDEAYAYLIDALHSRAMKAMRELLKRERADTQAE